MNLQASVLLVLTFLTEMVVVLEFLESVMQGKTEERYLQGQQ
jgi:hypothetical protein